MKVETTNLTSQPLCLAVAGIRTREIPVQVCDRNLHINNRQNDRETRRYSKLSFIYYKKFEILTIIHNDWKHMKIIINKKKKEEYKKD